MAEPVISLRNIRKSYERRYQQFLYREFFNWMVRRKPVDHLFWALDDISLDLYPGETVGIIGENGSGKSTLLKILSNVTDPTSGTIEINGRIASLLELGAGFHPHLTGRENIYLNGVILGMTKRTIDEQLDQIIEFSGIRDHIDQPVMTYSSGMYVRLGFSIAIHLNPDVLLVDEVLAVGDEEFQRKCKQTLRELHDKGKTILIVSHDLNAIRDLCSRIYWFKNGKIEMEGDREQVTFNYLTYVGAVMGMTSLTNGPLTILFERGKVILFWKGIEITKNCCIFTELFAANRSQWSLSAHWEILEFDKTEFTARSIWDTFPIEQTWRLKLISSHQFRFLVEMRVRSEFELRTDALNIMLTDSYTEWFSPTESGFFPSEFFEEYGQRIIKVGNGQPHVGVRAVKENRLSLPQLDINLISPTDHFMPQVSNTDAKCRSRTIHFARSESSEYYNEQTAQFEVLFNFEEI